jgi:hypothetical protein
MVNPKYAIVIEDVTGTYNAHNTSLPLHRTVFFYNRANSIALRCVPVGVILILGSISFFGAFNQMALDTGDTEPWRSLSVIPVAVFLSTMAFFYRFQHRSDVRRNGKKYFTILEETDRGLVVTDMDGLIPYKGIVPPGATVTIQIGPHWTRIITPKRRLRFNNMDIAWGDGTLFSGHAWPSHRPEHDLANRTYSAFLKDWASRHTVDRHDFDLLSDRASSLRSVDRIEPKRKPLAP